MGELVRWDTQSSRVHGTAKGKITACSGLRIGEEGS